MVLLTFFAAFLLFTNLDGEYLWSDEGDTAVLATSITKYGVPKAWDDVTFTDSDFGKRLNKNLVMVSHPWLQYYVTAASFLVFGETTFAARFPFALCGLLTIILSYALTLKLTQNRLMAISTVILLVLSVQFMLLSRQCRNYSLNMLMTCLLVMQFYRLNSWRNCILFAIAGILLFHTHPVGVAPIAALGLLTLVHKPFFNFRKWFWWSVPIMVCFTVPWFFLASAGYSENTETLKELKMLTPRLLQFGIECASVTPLIGVIVLFIVVKVRHRKSLPARKQKGPVTEAFSRDEKSLMILILAILAAFAGVMAVTQSRATLWTVGVRYTPVVIPLCAILSGLLIVKVSRTNWRIWVGLILVFGFTKLARIIPWGSFLDEPSAAYGPREKFVSLHVPEETQDRLLRTAQFSFLKSLFQKNPGTTAQICEFLKKNASPDDILITNYDWEPIYFHTRLPQGLKILPDYSIYPAAKEKDLPDYVFGVDGVKWIVWRRSWGPYRGHDCDQILEALANAGIPVEHVATLPETLWENRENIHFRRFPGNDYKFPWYQNLPDALIFKVNWPEAAGANKGS